MIELPLDVNPNRFDHARDWPRAFERSMFEVERTTLLDRVRSRLTASAYQMPFETDVHWTRLMSG